MPESSEMMPPVAIIAGGGALPFEIATSLSARGEEIFVCSIAEEADDALKEFPGETLGWGQIGKLFKLLNARGVQRVVLAGGITSRPEVKLQKMDMGTMVTLSQLLASMLGGDNALLSGVISVFEKRGFTVCNVADLLPDLVAAPGLIVGRKIKTADSKRIEYGAALSHALGPFDVGQASVVVGNRAVAVEGVEGTDAMLRRVADLRECGRLQKKKGGVLVKAVKPGQDERADLPTIGPNTVQNAHAAGLEGIGIEAEKTLIVGREKVIQLATDLNIFIYGFNTGQAGNLINFTSDIPSKS